MQEIQRIFWFWGDIIIEIIKANHQPVSVDIDT